MKKSITIVLAFAMVLCLAATAFAATPGSDSTAQAPQMPANIQMNGEAPDGETPTDLPELNGEAPDMNGQPPMNGQAPQFTDFDALASDGVISYETLANIKAYMEENKPADLPEMNGEAPTDLPELNGEAPADLPEMNGEAPADGLLAELLDAGVITQAEYEAIIAQNTK